MMSGYGRPDWPRKPSLESETANHKTREG
jgi:hypothetical protein